MFLKSLDFNRNCATDRDNLEKAKLRDSAIFPKMYVPFMVPTIGHNNGGKKCPWQAPGLGNHFGSNFTRILMKFNFCSKYWWNILKVVLEVAFGLYFHVQKSFFEKFPFVYIFWFFSSFLIFHQFREGLQLK